MLEHVTAGTRDLLCSLCETDKFLWERGVELTVIFPAVDVFVGRCRHLLCFDQNSKRRPHVGHVLYHDVFEVLFGERQVKRFLQVGKRRSVAVGLAREL